MALEVRELTPWFGAEVSGLVPAETIDDAVCRELSELMKDREMLVFRGFDIDRYVQNYLCELFRVDGQPDPDVVASNTEQQGSFYVSNARDGAAAPFGILMFHSDATYSTGPYEIVSLWAEEVMSPVAPTHFTSVTRAWDTLPDDLRGRVEGMVAEQTNQVQNRGADGERLLKTIREEGTITTPVVHVHPRSGRKLLYVSPLVTKRIVGLDHDESEALLADLFAHTAQPENVWTHEWRNNDLVVWDNLAVQHARPDVEEGGPVRTLRKATSPAFPADHVHVQRYGMMLARPLERFVPHAAQDENPSARVGFVGLGNQGAPMAHRIVAAGLECAVWARRHGAVDPFRDGPARVAESLPDLGRELDLLCCCVFDAAGTREVLFGPQGAARSMPRGAAIALHSTVAPREARELADDARRLGLDLIDAPVSGGADRAAKGDLVTMVGTDTASWTRYLPVFEAFSSLVVHVGAVGAGQLAKLLNNAMLTAHLGIAHDAFELAEQLGLDRRALEQVLLRGSGRSHGAELLIGAEGIAGIARSRARPTLGKDVRLLLDAVRDGSPGSASHATAGSGALLLTAAQRTIERIEGRGSGSHSGRHEGPQHA